MGAQAFSESIKSHSAKEGFNILAERAIECHGSDSYNGTISTCEFGSCKKRFDKYSEKNIKEAYKYIEDINYGEKWQADYIDLGVVEYKVIKAVKESYENSPKYKLKYIVEDFRGAKIDSFMTKTEAINKASELVTKNMKSYRITKDYDLVEGNNLLVRCLPEEKSYKTKPKKIPKGSRLVEIHEYLFFGWASC